MNEIEKIKLRSRIIIYMIKRNGARSRMLISLTAMSFVFIIFIYSLINHNYGGAILDTFCFAINVYMFCVSLKDFRNNEMNKPSDEDHKVLMGGSEED